MDLESAVTRLIGLARSTSEQGGCPKPAALRDEAAKVYSIDPWCALVSTREVLRSEVLAKPTSSAVMALGLADGALCAQRNRDADRRPRFLVEPLP